MKESQLEKIDDFKSRLDSLLDELIIWRNQEQEIFDALPEDDPGRLPTSGNQAIVQDCIDRFEEVDDFLGEIVVTKK